MSKNLKALLLSAFLLPGIGQLYKGERVKGILILLTVNLLLLASLFVVLRKMGSFLLTARISGPTEALALLDNISRNSPEAGLLLAGFALVWGYSVIDAVKTTSRNDSSVENV